MVRVRVLERRRRHAINHPGEIRNDISIFKWAKKELEVQPILCE
jgi:hypothetical protein